MEGIGLDALPALRGSPGAKSTPGAARGERPTGLDLYLGSSAASLGHFGRSHSFLSLGLLIGKLWPDNNPCLLRLLGGSKFEKRGRKRIVSSE